MNINFLEKEWFIGKLDTNIRDSKHLWQFTRITITSILILLWFKKVRGLSYDQMMDIDYMNNLFWACGAFFGYKTVFKDYSNYFHLTALLILFGFFYKLIFNTFNALWTRILTSKN